MNRFGNSLLQAMAVAAMVLGFSLAAHAQSTSGNSPKQVKKQKPVAKTHKVWTEDNISTVGTPADRYIDAADRQKEMQAADGSSKKTAQAGQAAATKSADPAKTPPLAIAKSVDDADQKIAWEQRDIQGQRETIERLQQQLNTAPPDQREHLQSMIEQHKQYIVETQKEMQGLEQQKKDLQKKPTASNNQ